MSIREQYAPGPASGAQIRKDRGPKGEREVDTHSRPRTTPSARKRSGKR